MSDNRDEILGVVENEESICMDCKGNLDLMLQFALVACEEGAEN